MIDLQKIAEDVVIAHCNAEGRGEEVDLVESIKLALQKVREETIEELENEILNRYKVGGHLPRWLELLLKDLRSLKKESEAKE